MCVGLPARVVSVNDGTAIIDANGAKRDVRAELLDDLEPGDYVMVHAGVAIAKINSDDEAEGSEVLGLLNIS
ncbi:MAG: HypC/HybG/HupF family hydrogenase formation chaperone [Lachnospiraceae bacterium]|jgi:hydrogenase expression/formation protein HypC|nr:HypC/HybG/HupF family hydrogenase formation chaperone [Lachnospiraceae bacterium]MBR4412090.1 HypC/HybG/HupF family hydrogenase formation chaperone [Lachnospiraceae bacterium]MBR5066962.1 HypC/HybG/HupF family hydrogenase formation chaperone [Lachnospiraceae bacterium]MBR5916827.1 HypC/HybG/HupF family hydrogenase formation chaperone [Lachnospiraceae bacterium]MBR6382426.1 HypC/HybG/HupF family hydrogenase formation chaperone [Lachnospiraceae bacterium]